MIQTTISALLSSLWKIFWKISRKNMYKEAAGNVSENFEAA